MSVAHSEVCLVRSWLEHRPIHHWWIMEGQHGETSTGVCKYCPAKKIFVNSGYGDHLNRRRDLKRREKIIAEEERGQE